MLREYTYRQLMNVSHDQYQEEPAHLVDWFLAIAGQDRELEEQARKRQR